MKVRVGGTRGPGAAWGRIGGEKTARIKGKARIGKEKTSANEEEEQQHTKIHRSPGKVGRGKRSLVEETRGEEDKGSREDNAFRGRDRQKINRRDRKTPRIDAGGIAQGKKLKKKRVCLVRWVYEGKECYKREVGLLFKGAEMRDALGVVGEPKSEKGAGQMCRGKRVPEGGFNSGAERDAVSPRKLWKRG